MSPRIFSVMTVLAAAMAACSFAEQATAQETPNTAAPDTTLANRYVEKAIQFARDAQYDSTLTYYEKARVIYQAAGAWERYVHCYNKMGEQYWRKRALVTAQEYLNEALKIGLERWGEQHPEVASSYQNLGVVQHLKGNNGQALAFWNQALAIRLVVLGEHHPDVARTYHNLGLYYDVTGNYKQALVFYDKAVTIKRATLGEQDPDLAMSYNNIGIVYFTIGALDQAREFLDKALDIRVATLGPQHPDVAQAYNNLGGMFMARGAFDQAIAFFHKALPIALATLGPQHPDVAKGYGNLGLAHFFKGDYDPALEFLNKTLAVQLAVLGENHSEVALTYHNLGGVYDQKNDYDRALEFYHEALRIYIDTLGEQHAYVAQTYINVGKIHYEKGALDQALAFYEKALAIYLGTVGEHHPGVAKSYINMGNIYNDKGDSEQALAFYEKALVTLPATVGEQHPDVAQIHNNIGIVYFQQDDHDRALDSFSNALNIRLATLGSEHPDVAMSYINIGTIWLSKGDYDQALDAYQQALQANVPGFTSADPYVNPPLEGVLSEQRLLETLFSKAQTLAVRFEEAAGTLATLEAAVQTYHLAATLIDRMRHGYKAEGSKFILAENITTIYNQAIATALLLHRVTGQDAHKQAAFYFAEKNKAGILLDALSETRAKQFAGIPDSLLQQERQLRIDLAGYETNLVKERDKPIAQRDNAKIALWQGTLFDLRQRYTALIEEFETRYPDYYRLKYSTETALVEDVQRQLDDETAMIEYYTGTDSLYIFTLTQTDFDVETVPLRRPLADQIRRFRLEIRNGVGETVRGDFIGRASWLYQYLLKPVAKHLEGKTHLLLVPDGALTRLPFETLLTDSLTKDPGPSYSTLPFLIKTYHVSYIYTATMIDKERRLRPGPSRSYLAFAPVRFDQSPDDTLNAFLRPLQQSQREVTTIQRYVKQAATGPVHIYLGREASEARLKQVDAAQYRFVHFATHGFTNDKVPALSRLMLSPGTSRNEDDVLYLGEVYNLSLNAEVVVLSACETGLGRLVRGEGIIGLTRGFLYAGARQVLVSLWRTYDGASADLMIEYFGALLKGAASHEAALRQAKLDLIEKGRFAAPVYWSPFILVGL